MSGLNWYSFFEALSLIFGVIFLILSIILVIQKSQNEIKKEVYNSNEDIKKAQKELCNLSKELLKIKHDGSPDGEWRKIQGKGLINSTTPDGIYRGDLYVFITPIDQ